MISLRARLPPMREKRNGVEFVDCIESLGDVGNCCCCGGDELTEQHTDPGGEGFGSTIASGI